MPFSDRSLCHSELGVLKAMRIVRYFIPNLAPYHASFLCLEYATSTLPKMHLIPPPLKKKILYKHCFPTISLGTTVIPRRNE